MSPDVLRRIVIKTQAKYHFDATNLKSIAIKKIKKLKDQNSITKVGTWNLRTLNSEPKRKQLTDDLTHFGCEIVAVQETHYKGTRVETLKANTGETYTL